MILKKVLLSCAVSMGVVIMSPVGTFAAPAVNPGITNVTGTVTSNGKPVDAAIVDASCAGPQGAVTGSDMTDASGGYLIPLSISGCPVGSVVTVAAHKGSGNGVNSAKANNVAPKLNIALVNVNVALPEMGTVVGGLAAVGAGGALLVTRRKLQIKQS